MADETRAWSDETGLHLARDAIGHRSLYWGRDPNGRVVWGTRVRDVLARGVARTLDPIGLATYLSTSYVPGARTLVKGVRAVEPGTVVTFATATSEPVVRTTWSLPASPSTYDSEEVLRERLRASLEETVGRLLPDGPVAATLSGGIDSSAVVALVAQKRPVTCLSITFGPEHKDELAWSGMVARHVGAEHVPITVTPDDVMRRFDETVGALSEPNGDPLTVPNTMLFEQAVARGRHAVFNGEGGDPCFGGPKNAPLLLAEVYGEDDGRWPRERAYLRAHQKLWGELDQVMTRFAEVPEGALEALVTPWFADARWPSFLDRLMAINVAWKGAGHILPKVEHLGLRLGAEPRSPLFERDIVALAFAIPSSLKRAGSVEKHLLKESVRDLLPAAILERPKSGMLVPVEAWFSGPLRNWARERLLDGLAPRGVIEKRYLERLMDAKIGGLRPRRGVKIWLLLTLEAWLRLVFDRQPGEV